MILYTPILIMALITALTQIAYLLDDGRSLQRYLLILVLYIVAIFMVLPDKTPETFTIITVIFWALMVRRLWQEILPKDYLGRKANLNAFRTIDLRKKINVWDGKRSDVLRYMLYCLALIIAQVIAIDYF